MLSTTTTTTTTTSVGYVAPRPGRSLRWCTLGWTGVKTSIERNHVGEVVPAGATIAGRSAGAAAVAVGGADAAGAADAVAGGGEVVKIEMWHVLWL